MAAPAPNPTHLRARIRQLAGARRPPVAAELLQDAERIHSSLISFKSCRNTSHNPILNDLPGDFGSIPWMCVYDAGEAYRQTGLIDKPWSPSCLDQWTRSSWCFTLLPLLSCRRVVRVTVDRTSTWFSDRGRPRTTRKDYPDDLLVNLLRTKKPIEGIFCRMIEITLADQTPAKVALCRIREDPSGHVEQQQADGIAVILEATDVEIDQPQQVNLEFQHGLDTETNMNPTASNINRDIQPGLNIGASMNQMTTVAILEPTDMERGQPQQEIQTGLNIEASTNQMTTTSDISEDLECLLGPNVADYMDHMRSIASHPHEGISNGIMGNDHTSNFLENVSIIWANKDLYTLIDRIDEDSAAVLAYHVKHAALILKGFGATSINPSHVVG